MTTTTQPPLTAVITTVRPARRRPRLNTMGKIMVYPPLIAASLGLTTAIAAGTWQAAHPTPPAPPKTITKIVYHTPAVSPGHPAVIKGCTEEDTCTINYAGDGTWTIAWDAANNH